MQIGNVKRMHKQITLSFFWLSFLCLTKPGIFAQNNAAHLTPRINRYAPKILKLSVGEYDNRVRAVWIGQMAAAIMGWPFEHHTASVKWISQLPEPYNHQDYAPVDDDWYYEMVAL